MTKQHSDASAAVRQRFVRTDEFARIFGFSRPYAQGIIARGEISVVRFGPRMILIPVEAIEEFARQLDQARTLSPTENNEQRSVAYRAPAPKKRAPKAKRK